MGKRSPSQRWSQEHGYGNGAHRRSQMKRAYSSWWRARLNCWRLNRKYGDDMNVYSCYWGQDYRNGEVAEKHYHLGHPTQNDMWGY